MDDNKVPNAPLPSEGLGDLPGEENNDGIAGEKIAPVVAENSPATVSGRAPMEPAPLQRSSEDAELQMRRLSRRSFLWAGLAVASGYGGLRWLNSRSLDAGIPWPFRRVLDANGDLARDYFSPQRLATEFPVSRAGKLRVNGGYGLDEEVDLEAWRLEVSGLFSGETLSLDLAAIKALPHVEMVTELKCIEGWATIVHWGGVRLVDFLRKYPPATISGEEPNIERKPQDVVPYLAAATPDGGYYVGLERETMLHSQTLLCYEMDGKPLTQDHGAPLRLVTPVKYGIKHLKRLGTLQFTDRRPADFWAERGYDWYSGH